MAEKAVKTEKTKPTGKQFAEFAPPERFVSIRGADYRLREMTLAEKIRVLGPMAESVAKNVDFKKAGEGDMASEVQLFVSIGAALPEVLALSVPDFKDWEELGESETREAVRAVFEVNDFFGFTRNFTECLGRAMTSPER